MGRCSTYCQLESYKQYSVKFQWNTNNFIQEHAYGFAYCKMAGILFTPNILDIMHDFEDNTNNPVV